MQHWFQISRGDAHDFIDYRCLLHSSLFSNQVIQSGFACWAQFSLNYLLEGLIMRRNIKRAFPRWAVLTSRHQRSHLHGCVWSLILLTLRKKLSSTLCVCALTYLDSLLPSHKNNHCNFPCNETLCGDQRLRNTHAEKVMAWLNPPNNIDNTCLKSMTLCLGLFTSLRKYQAVITQILWDY